jgi:hypothetical protein
MRWTEKQTEEYLTEETRQLTGSDGSRVSVTMFRTYWITYDAVRVDDAYTEAELVDWAQRPREGGRPRFTKTPSRSNMNHLDTRYVARAAHQPTRRVTALTSNDA